MKRLAFLLVAVTAGCARDLSTDNFNHPFEPWVPRDVRARIAIGRNEPPAQGCMHFSGESGEGMPGRQAYIDKMVRKTCRGLDERKRMLMERHQSAQVRQLITDHWD